MSTTTERTEVEVWRDDVLDLVTIVGRADNPAGCLTFVRLGDVDPEVRVRLHRGRWTCQTHGRPNPGCRHIDSAARAIQHRIEELITDRRSIR